MQPERHPITCIPTAGAVPTKDRRATARRPCGPRTQARRSWGHQQHDNAPWYEDSAWPQPARSLQTQRCGTARPSTPASVAARSHPPRVRAAHGLPAPGLALPALPARMMPTTRQAQRQHAASRNGEAKTDTRRRGREAHTARPFSPAIPSCKILYTLQKFVYVGFCTASAPIRPYSARASAKIRIRIMPTKSLGCCALALRTRTRTLGRCPKSASGHGTMSCYQTLLAIRSKHRLNITAQRTGSSLAASTPGNRELLSRLAAACLAAVNARQRTGRL